MIVAVIKTGGKQYLVRAKDKIKVEKLDITEGKELFFKDVLLVVDEKGGSVKIGTPIVKTAKVTAKVIKQGKADKVTGAHYKPKTRNKKLYGHRQPFTEVEILKIEG